MLNVMDPEYGAHGTAKQVDDGVMNDASDKTKLTSADAHFSAADVGDVVSVEKAGVSRSNLIGTIVSFESEGEVHLDVEWVNSVTNAYVAFGPDDADAFQSVFNAAIGLGSGTVPCPGVYIPPGRYIIGHTVTIGIPSQIRFGLRILSEPATQISMQGTRLAGHFTS